MGVCAWLLGDALIAFLHPDRTQMAPFLTYFAVVGPAGGIAFAVIGLMMQELIVRNIVQPTSPLVTFLLTGLIPGLANGLFWGGIAEGIAWARVRERPLFLALVIGLGVYWALVLGLAVT